MILYKMDVHFRLSLPVLVCLVLHVFKPVEVESSFQSGSVTCVNKKCKFRPNVIVWDFATAVGTFNETILTTGWGVLDIVAGHGRVMKYCDDDLMYATGYLEGVFTARQMENNYINVFNNLFPPPVDKDLVDKLNQWFIDQRKWIDMMVSIHKKRDPVWRHVGYVMMQLDGLYDGYRSVSQSKNPLDQFAINLMNAIGDMYDLPQILKRSSIPDWTKFTPDEARNYFYTSGHCSALIKLLPGYENMFISHSTWSDYELSNRIYKHFNVMLKDSDTVNRLLSFPSYPGVLSSMDDLYVLEKGMMIMETTNQIFNTTLYDEVTVDSLFSWQRMLVANMLAQDGKQWADIFKRYNSGTYNNQYMILDMTKFKPNQTIPDGTLWVAEQIPGLVVDRDLTDILRAGYFASYNVPFFEEIFHKSGYADYIAKHGLEFSYELAPRAKIFRRDAAKVKDMDSMKKLMRSNDYKHDPYSGGDPTWGAICARGDLDAAKPTTFGCFDSKVFDVAMGLQMKANIISGPTLGSGFHPFSWTGPFANVSHVGLPDTFNFDFIQTQPSLHPRKISYGKTKWTAWL